jgi:DNA-binding NarL/FixJ family response regulator
MSCLLSGARGFLLKPLPPRDLVAAVADVICGLPVLCSEAQAQLVSWLRRVGPASACKKLTQQEGLVMGYLAEGLRPKEISKRLGTSPETIHAHMVRAYRKLGVHCRSDAVANFLAGQPDSQGE